MDEKIQRIMNVYETLTSAQKKELMEELKKRNQSRIINESLGRVEKGHTVVMGPLSGKCPYCGR